MQRKSSHSGLHDFHQTTKLAAVPLASPHQEARSLNSGSTTFSLARRQAGNIAPLQGRTGLTSLQSPRSLERAAQPDKTMKLTEFRVQLARHDAGQGQFHQQCQLFLPMTTARCSCPACSVPQARKPQLPVQFGRSPQCLEFPKTHGSTDAPAHLCHMPASHAVGPISALAGPCRSDGPSKGLRRTPVQVG